MEVNELRIGNYLLDYYNETPKQMTADLIMVIDLIETKHKNEYQQIFHPIPLDEDWLRDFGFKKRKKLWHFHINFRIGIDDNMNLYLDGTHWIKLEYVHRLQNLYFELSDEELIRKKCPKCGVKNRQ